MSATKYSPLCKEKYVVRVEQPDFVAAVNIFVARNRPSGVKQELVVPPPNLVVNTETSPPCTEGQGDPSARGSHAGHRIRHRDGGQPGSTVLDK